MSCTIEKVLSDARMLVNRLRDHDSAADNLIGQATVLHRRVDAMRTYQEDLNELNEIARHRPRSALIMNLAQENSQIRELQQENRELRTALEEHQSALELIMSKYREQVVKLVVANRLDRHTSSQASDIPVNVQDKIDKICEMASVMNRAIQLDDDAAARQEEVQNQLKLENKTLRELLHIAVNGSQFCATETADSEIQTSLTDLDTSGTSTTSESSVVEKTVVDVNTKETHNKAGEEDSKESGKKSDNKESEKENESIKESKESKDSQNAEDKNSSLISDGQCETDTMKRNTNINKKNTPKKEESKKTPKKDESKNTPKKDEATKAEDKK